VPWDGRGPLRLPHLSDATFMKLVTSSRVAWFDSLRMRCQMLGQYRHLVASENRALTWILVSMPDQQSLKSFCRASTHSALSAPFSSGTKTEAGGSAAASEACACFLVDFLFLVGRSFWLPCPAG